MSQTGVGQQVSLYCNFLLLSRENSKVNSLLLAPKHHPRSVCGTRQKPAGSKHLWAHCPFHHASEILSSKVTEGMPPDLLIHVTAFLHFVWTVAFRKEEIPLLIPTADNIKKEYLGGKKRGGGGKLQFLFFPIFLSFASSPIRNLKKRFDRQEINRNLTKVVAIGIKIDGKHQWNLRAKVLAGIWFGTDANSFSVVLHKSGQLDLEVMDPFGSPKQRDAELTWGYSIERVG